MKYQFDGGAFGRCQVELRTAGKHGFAVPKIFQISSLENPAAPTYTFRFTNNIVAGVTSGEATNARLCRIAIAQFLQWPARDQVGTTQYLDTTIPPFDGPVLNEQGAVLTVTRLHSPRGTARATERKTAKRAVEMQAHADERPESR